MVEEHSTPYLRGFVHGMHFLLLALEARVSACTSPGEVREVLAVYHQVVAAQGSLPPLVVEVDAPDAPSGEAGDGPAGEACEYEVAG